MKIDKILENYLKKGYTLSFITVDFPIRKIKIRYHNELYYLINGYELYDGVNQLNLHLIDYKIDFKSIELLEDKNHYDITI